MTPRIRPAVAALPAYRAGRAPTPGADGRAFKLSSNENPYPPLPGVLDAVARAASTMNRYPDAGNTAITDALAERLGVDRDRIAFGTGSVAVLYHLLQAVCEPGDEVVHAWRSFEAYPIAVQLTGATSVTVPLRPDATHDLDAMLAAITERTKVIMVCTPNNPTGPAIRHDDLVAFVERVPPGVLIMIDEAYVEFVSDPAAARGLELIDRDDVVVVRTFSKAYGLAGFRVGYAVGSPEVAAAVRSCALPFGVSVTAQAAVLASLDAEPALLERVRALVAERASLVAGLREALTASGLVVPDAQGNFVWLPSGERTADHAAAFEAAGLAVRAFLPDASGPTHAGLRISVDEPDANRRVLDVAATLR